MSVVEITSMSTKGQVVIPASVRKTLNIAGGAKLLVIQDGENILLKPIHRPELTEFSEIIRVADKIRDELNLDENDINKAIKESRQARANRP